MADLIDTTRFGDVTRNDMCEFGMALGLPATGAARELDRFLDRLPAALMQTRNEVDAIAQPGAGEIRLLDSIERLPVAEMSRALR